MCPIDRKPTLGHIMAWGLYGTTPFPEPFDAKYSIRLFTKGPLRTNATAVCGLWTMYLVRIYDSNIGKYKIDKTAWLGTLGKNDPKEWVLIQP